MTEVFLNHKLKFEIEILEDSVEFHTDITFQELIKVLKKSSLNSRENIEIITKLEEWESILFGVHRITRIGEKCWEDKEDKADLEELTTAGFWIAMEQNELNFKEYLETNPTPFERKVATLEYLNSRIANEQKYCMILMNMEKEDWVGFQTGKGNKDKDSTSDDDGDGFDDEWI